REQQGQESDGSGIQITAAHCLQLLIKSADVVGKLNAKRLQGWLVEFKLDQFLKSCFGQSQQGVGEAAFVMDQHAAGLRCGGGAYAIHRTQARMNLLEKSVIMPLTRNPHPDPARNVVHHVRLGRQVQLPGMTQPTAKYALSKWRYRFNDHR